MLPNLSKLVDANAEVGVPVYSDINNMPSLKGDKQLQDVIGDGSCLYHCLIKLRNLSDPWLAETTPPAPDVETLKRMMEQYFLANYETHFLPYWHDYLLKYFNISLQNAYSVDPGEIAFRYTSEVMMKQGAWGGELEIDIAARLFGVIIHKFERDTVNVKSSTPMLVTSFYPTEELNDKNRTTAKWSLVLFPGHYNYVIPEPPRNAVVRQTPSTPSTSSETPPLDDARTRADMMKRLRDRKTGGSKELSSMEQKNATLRTLTKEREARQKLQPQSPYCARGPIPDLTEYEKRQLDRFERLLLLEEEEKGTDDADDAALARRMQREEEERAKQIESDRLLAESLS